MSKELDKADHWDRLDKVVKLYLEGNNAPMIAKQLRVRVADVEGLVKEWQYYVKHNKTIQERARESIHVADAHFDKIIRELWSVIEEAGDGGNLSAKNVALKTLTDAEVKRTQMLEKAGLADNDAMAELLLENERKIDLIKELLRNRAKDCAHCRPIILEELAKISEKAEPIVIRTEDENGL